MALNRRLLPIPIREGWRSNLDWIAWLELSSQAGMFGYVRKPLVHRTLHSDGATRLGLAHRTREDGLVLDMLWPRPISTLIGAMYAAGRSP